MGLPLVGSLVGLPLARRSGADRSGAGQPGIDRSGVDQSGVRLPWSVLVPSRALLGRRLAGRTFGRLVAERPGRRRLKWSPRGSWRQPSAPERRRSVCRHGPVRLDGPPARPRGRSRPGRVPGRESLAGLRTRGRYAWSRSPTGRRFPDHVGRPAGCRRGGGPVLMTAVVPAHRCGAVPDSHRVPSLVATPGVDAPPHSRSAPCGSGTSNALILDVVVGCSSTHQMVCRFAVIFW